MTGLKKNSEITNWSRSPIYLHNEEWYRGTDGTSRFSLSNRSNSTPDRCSYCRWSPCVTGLNKSLKFRNGGVFCNYSTTKGAMANWMVSFDSAHQIGLFPHWTDVLTIDEGDRLATNRARSLESSTRTVCFRLKRDSRSFLILHQQYAENRSCQVHRCCAVLDECDGQCGSMSSDDEDGEE